MIDREKVIKGLECCKMPFSKCYDGGCPYFEDEGCKAKLKREALELLKAQEPMEPEVKIYNGTDIFYKCTSCHKSFLYNKQKFCDNCGQAVKWDE